MFVMKNDSISIHREDKTVYFVFREPEFDMDEFLEKLTGIDYRIACYGGYDNAVALDMT